MTRAETIRKFPKSGWRNLLARHLAGMTKRPAPTQFLEYQTQTTLHLPFAGEWYVYWGGRSVAWNRHVVVRDQRFAYDFLILAPATPGSRIAAPAKTMRSIIVSANQFMLPPTALW